MKTCLYARVSTDRQSNGLESQIRALEEYCKARGVLEWTLFAENGVSGTKNSRPELDKLMEEVKAGNVSTVIVFSFSRYARSTKFLIDSLELFKQLNVNFISISENVDLATPLGTAMFTIISALSTLERDLISERVKNGIANARAKNKQIGRPKKIDYELIYRLRKEGYSFRKIHKLTGVSHGSISNILKKYVQ